MFSNLFSLLWILGVSVGVSLAGEWCYNGDLLYCDWGCCDSWPNESCCPFHVWIIVVSVIGALAAIATVICVVCVCVVQKRNRQRLGGGQVISGPGLAPPATVAYGTPYGQPTVQVNQGYVLAQPPAYPVTPQT